MYINVFLLDEIQYVLSVWKMSIDKIISLHLIHVHLSIIKIISKLTGKFNIDFFYRWPIDTVIIKFHFKQIYTYIRRIHGPVLSLRGVGYTCVIIILSVMTCELCIVFNMWRDLSEHFITQYIGQVRLFW